jgi:TatD family-associated radical SAM protein
MTITYEVDTGLYINVTNRCTNRCEFCIRNNGDGAYGSNSLWLEREPTVDEVLSDVFSRDLTKYSELVFCGYGEPTVRLNDIREIALDIKKRYPSIKIRVNTNGHSDLILATDTAPLYKDAFDVVSISLNTPNADKYVEMCHPVYHKAAFDALLTFAKNVNNYVQKTLLSVVRQTLSDQELEKCYKIAADLGVTLKVRDYISKDESI